MNIDDLDNDHIGYMALVRENWDQIHEIKEKLANFEIEAAKGLLLEFPEPLRISLWKAPSRGGVWTTEERALLKGDVR